MPVNTGAPLFIRATWPHWEGGVGANSPLWPRYHPISYDMVQKNGWDIIWWYFLLANGRYLGGACGQIRNQFKLCQVMVKFRTDPSGATCHFRDYSSHGLNFWVRCAAGNVFTNNSEELWKVCFHFSFFNFSDLWVRVSVCKSEVLNFDHVPTFPINVCPSPNADSDLPMPLSSDNRTIEYKENYLY